MLLFPILAFKAIKLLFVTPFPLYDPPVGLTNELKSKVSSLQIFGSAEKLTVGLGFTVKLSVARESQPFDPTNVTV